MNVIRTTSYDITGDFAGNKKADIALDKDKEEATKVLNTIGKDVKGATCHHAGASIPQPFPHSQLAVLLMD